MRYVMALYPVASGRNGESVYTLLHEADGEIVAQMEKLTNSELIPFSIEGFYNIKEAVEAGSNNTHGFLIDDDVSTEELMRWLRSKDATGHRLAVTIDEDYTSPKGREAIEGDSIWKICLQKRVYAF